jgi:hypothetical protein
MFRRSDPKLLLPFVALVAITTLCGSVPGQRKYTEPEKIAGQINWIAREAATGKTIDVGRMTIHVREIKVKRESSEDEEPFFSKRIDLNRDFYFEIAEFPETDLADLEGFGLVIEHRNLSTFCWEWFNVDRGKHATKLQETGELSFDAKKIGSRWEMTRMDFLTDVTFRVNLDERDGPKDDPKWRITILKGSYVNWPSLVGDTVTPNT